LPFEPEYYRQHDVRAVFVGHPQADSAPEHVDTENARRALGFRNDGLVIAMLPGSRVSEVSRLGALFAESAKLIADDVSDVRFVTPVATPALRPLIDTQLADAGVNRLFTLIDGQSETAMASADVVLLASGTAALESALLCKPTVAAYRVHALTALFLRAFRLLKIDRFTLPNLLTKTPQIPEFIQEDASPQALSSAVLALLRDSDRRAAIALRFAKLRTELALGANQRAAETVASLANHAATTTISN
jgi:lipid-A-disaccharide synthase